MTSHEGGIRSALVIVLTAVAAIVFGMMSPRQIVPLQTVGRSHTCYQPLDVICRGTSCPSFSDALAEAKEYGRGGLCFIARTGECGSLRFARQGDGFVSTTRYFRGETLIAVRETTDDLDDSFECRAWTHYGERVDCKAERVVDYCQRR